MGVGKACTVSSCSVLYTKQQRPPVFNRTFGWQAAESRRPDALLEMVQGLKRPGVQNDHTRGGGPSRARTGEGEGLAF